MKLVRESLNEYLGFTEDGDPVKNMGIGMDELIHKWMSEHGVAKHKYRITPKKRIIGDDSVVFSHQQIKEFPEYIKFAHINGSFHVNNCGLENLKGGPELVQGSFFCSGNPLKSSGLIGGPKQVIGAYAASNCGLESLEGIATKIEGEVYINDNSLYSLEFMPEKIGDLYMSNNPIGTLEHFPKEIKGDLHITGSKLIPDIATILRICNVTGEIYSQ
jgi:hypothetical protein